LGGGTLEEGGGRHGRRKECRSLHAHAPPSLLLPLPLRKKGGAKSRLHARGRERVVAATLNLGERRMGERESPMGEKKSHIPAQHVWEKRKREKDGPVCV
jgi:hypothetical protein